jgi:hypothetical protein
LPADGPGAEGFSNLALFSLLGSGPVFLSWMVNGGWATTGVIAVLVSFPLLAGYWYVVSRITSRKNEKVKYPGRPIESYLKFHKKSDRLRYHGSNTVTMETFQQMYFNGDVEFNGDCLEILEYRHDWANFAFTMSHFKYVLFSFVPEVIMHTRSQGKQSPNIIYHETI